MGFLLNEPAARRPKLAESDRTMLGASAPDRVRPYLALWPSHAGTPLVPLPRLAAEHGIASIHIKDEGPRLGLGSFKALGGAYAVMRLVHRHAEQRLGRSVGIGELLDPEMRAVAGALTVGCATDGNHGRSVAAGARLMGCRSTIFLHGGVSPAREAAIAAYAGEIVRVPGTYDDSVDEAQRVCEERGWIVVSDTSWPGYEEIPGIVAQGYTVLADEALAQLAGMGAEMPTHVFLQAGVGGFAAAMACFLGERLAAARPKFIVVEPDRAACVLASVERGEVARIDSHEPTIMAMLECYQPSLMALRILLSCADAFQSIPDEAAAASVLALANPRGGDRPVTAGESGAAGLAGFLAAMHDPGQREALSLGPQSRVLVVNTETATDPASWEAIVGRPPPL